MDREQNRKKEEEEGKSKEKTSMWIRWLYMF